MKYETKDDRKVRVALTLEREKVYRNLEPTENAGDNQFADIVLGRYRLDVNVYLPPIFEQGGSYNDSPWLPGHFNCK